VTGYLTLYPLTFGLRLGQFSLILQASWAAGALLLEQRRDRWAGLAFSPLLIKPELLIPVGLFVLVKRRWQSVATLLPIALGAALVSVAIVGVGTAIQYPGFVLGSTATNGAGVAPNLMVDYSGAIAASFGHGASVTRPLASAALAVLSLGAVALLAGNRWGRGVRHARAGRLGSEAAGTGFRVEWLAVSLAALLCDPHLYLQDTIIVVPAAAALLAALQGSARNQFAAVLLLGWGIERLALYPNDHLHINLFALFLTAMLVVLLAKAWPRRTAHQRARIDRLPARTAHLRAGAPGERSREPHGTAEVGSEGG
ncbi:MAG: glycosyltransferase family 87 protein, partial [Tepidiformaceae bacterium]